MTMPQFGNFSQASQRRFQRYTDQHGRTYTAYIEIKSGYPCTPIDPEFRAPLMPPQGHLKVDPERPGRINVDYRTWLAELQAAHKEWVDKGRRVGIELYRDQFDPTKEFNSAILLKIGPPPLPVEPVVAASQGHPWVLGLKGPNGEEPLMPEGLARFFQKPVDALPVYEVEYQTTEA